MLSGHLFQNSQNNGSESEASLQETKDSEGPQSLSLVHHVGSPVRPTTPSDITSESISSPSHSDSLSSPECDSAITSNNKYSEDRKSTTPSQGQQPKMQNVSSEVEPQSQSTTTVEPQQMQRECALPSHLTPGYKLVIDNIDSTVNPRYMLEDAQNQSLHYVQLYAVKDRVDFSAIPDCPPSSAKNLFSILPTSNDYQMLKDNNMAVLVSRILVEHDQFFSENFKDLATWHIQHQYSAQMSKSEVVNLSFFYTCILHVDNKECLLGTSGSAAIQ